MFQVATNTAGSICGTFCGLGLIFIVIGILIIVGFFACAIYLTYWLYKKAVKNGVLEAEKQREKNR